MPAGTTSPGMVASYCTLPVIRVPCQIIQFDRRVGLRYFHPANAGSVPLPDRWQLNGCKNAGILAAQILGTATDISIAAKLADYKKNWKPGTGYGQPDKCRTKIIPRFPTADTQFYPLIKKNGIYRNGAFCGYFIFTLNHRTC